MGGPAGSGGASGGSNVSLGGAQDCGYFRKTLDAGQVPRPGDCDASGFFAEHHTKLPPPSCGKRVCLQSMLGVMGNLLDGRNCTMLHVGLNSPLEANPGSRPPLTLAVVVDTSGSMLDQDKIGFVRQGLGQLIDGLKDGDRFALITYSDAVQTRFPMQDITLNRAGVRTIVQSLAAAGSTNFYGGLEAGYREVIANYDSGRQNRVIMMSDGMPTAGNTSEASIISMSRAYNSDGIGLTTIGLGTAFNVNLMRNLALQADGNFYFLENSGAVSEVFTEELGYFTVPIAFDLKLSFTTGSHYAFGRAYGSPLWQNTPAGGQLEVPSVFIAHRERPDDVTPDGGRRGGGSALMIEVAPRLSQDDGSGLTSAEVATIGVEFREPGTNSPVTDTVQVSFPFAPWLTPERGYFGSTDLAAVQKSFVMLNIFFGLDRAVTAFHKPGRTAAEGTEAVAQLDRLIAAVKDYNTELNQGQGDTDIKFDIELLEKLRGVLLAQGITAPTDSRVPTDPWPAD
jgi:Ca-activated chloride channel family protein